MTFDHTDWVRVRGVRAKWWQSIVTKPSAPRPLASCPYHPSCQANLTITCLAKLHLQTACPQNLTSRQSGSIPQLSCLLPHQLATRPPHSKGFLSRRNQSEYENPEEKHPRSVFYTPEQLIESFYYHPGIRAHTRIYALILILWMYVPAVLCCHHRMQTLITTYTRTLDGYARRYPFTAWRTKEEYSNGCHLIPHRKGGRVRQHSRTLFLANLTLLVLVPVERILLRRRLSDIDVPEQEPISDMVTC